MPEFVNIEGLIALVSLTVMEIVLGIDNIVFLSIVIGKLERNIQGKARMIGLSLALFFRIALLFSITWLTRLTSDLFSVSTFSVSGRDLIMLSGGLFLLAKSTSEIHEKIEGEDEEIALKSGPAKSFLSVVIQISILDIIFSVDSIITAVGLVQDLTLMIIAVVLSLGVMLAFSGRISDFIHKHPTVKMLALSFLLMIGVLLIADGLHFHIPKGYIYFAMAFSLGVEFLNLYANKKNGKERSNLSKS